MSIDLNGSTIVIALSLVFVIEGLLYAFFPDAMQRMMKMAIEMPPEQLRMIGLFLALSGTTMIWVFQYF